MYRILVSDDEITVLKGVEFHLQENDQFTVETASDRKSAVNLLENNEFDIVVTDLMFPEVADGLKVIETAKKQWYNPSVLAMSAFDSIDNAVATVQAGADDFVSKGFGVEELSLRIDNLLKKKEKIRQLSVENRILRETIQHQFSDFQIVGNSEQMQELLQKINRLASDARATCLIQGESGSGKDLIARTIHALSQRRKAPFVPINCAAISEQLIESELFGHEKGAFTGAYIAKQGKFEQANGGVVFLDEIGELPLHLQVRLLRVLEERNFYRVGGKTTIDVDVMILAASNQDLEQQVVEGKFREDLFFRLNVIKIWVPSLRERKEDIIPLSNFFLEKFNKQRKKNLVFSKKSLLKLSQYDFPGNVRELRNIIEDAFVFCEGGTINPDNLLIGKESQTSSEKDRNESDYDDEEVKSSEEKSINLNQINLLPLQEARKEFERTYLIDILQKSNWNLGEAAAVAGVSREWIGKKIKMFGIKKVNKSSLF